MKAPQSIDIDDYRRKVEIFREIYEDALRRFSQYGDNPKIAKHLRFATIAAWDAFLAAEAELAKLGSR